MRTVTGPSDHNGRMSFLEWLGWNNPWTKRYLLGVAATNALLTAAVITTPHWLWIPLPLMLISPFLWNRVYKTLARWDEELKTNPIYSQERADR